VYARCAGADVVVPTADLAAGWRDDTPGLAVAVSAASSLAERRVGVRDSSRCSAHDLGQALSAINLATELAIGQESGTERLLQQIRTQTQDAGIHAWLAGRAGRTSPCALRPVDLSSLLHRVAMTEPDVAVYDSTGSVWVLGDESRLEQLLEELIQQGRRSATNQRIDVRFGGTGTVEMALRGLGRPRSQQPEADFEFGLMNLCEIVNDLGGKLRADHAPPVHGRGPVLDGAGVHPVVRLSFPILPGQEHGPGLVKVPPDRMAIQTGILEGVLRHAPLPESLEAIVTAIEQQLPGTKCSVLLLDDQLCLNHSAGAGLPEAYRQQIDGVAIGYGQGSCGTAAFLGRPVIAADVETDRHWVDFKDVALEHDLRSCWSTPILAADGGAVLGTFAVYRSEVWEPDEAATRLVSRFTYLAAVAIGHHRLFKALAMSESRFRGAFEGATAGMALVELDGSFRMVNPALCAMLDTEATDLSDANVLDLVEATHRGLISDSWNELLSAPDRADERHQEPIDVPFISHHGDEPLWVSFRSALVTTDDGQPPYVYVEIRDITASRRHAVERRAREAAEAANRAKTDFLALVSHELRTPLNAILGFAQIMQLIELDAAQRARSVENIIKAGHHLLELIDELLDLSMIEAGQRSTSVEDIDADEVIDEALQLLQPLADSRHIPLRRGLSARLAESDVGGVPDGADRSAVLRADRQAVRQVLINLLGNAVKFTPSGGEVGIVVSCGVESSVRISVFDSGPGIPAEAIDGLFEPFNRLAPEADPGAEGTGLGLSVAARLIEEMQGQFGVESRVGTGSCFWVDLPGSVGSDCSPLPDPDGCEAARPPAGENRATTGVVLYVEDDPACVQVMTAALALRPGIGFLTAGTAADGLTVARSQKIDVILLDIGLPDGSGWDLLRTLRDQPETASIPVVVLTAGPGVVPPGGPTPEVIMTKPLD
ncbi:MAG: ATP-binding protein, partial [Acidimicrobiales bacterium]